MANRLKVQEQEAIKHLTALGWGIRRIARELRLSRNTVRGYVRTEASTDAAAIAEAILKSSANSTPRRPKPN
jgi:DNA-binding NarL/FixJ family response regulator